MRVRLANFSVARVRKFAVARVRLANFSVGGVRLATLSMASQRQLQRVCTNFRADSLSPLLLIYILILLFSILERESLHCRLSKSVCNADSFWQSAMQTLFGSLQCRLFLAVCNADSLYPNSFYHKPTKTPFGVYGNLWKIFCTKSWKNRSPRPPKNHLKTAKTGEKKKKSRAFP